MASGYRTKYSDCKPGLILRKADMKPCEYPGCKELGFNIGNSKFSAILCPPHEDELDELLEKNEEKAIELILKITVSRIKTDKC